MSLSGYIEAGLSDHKPVCVEMRRTNIRAHAALPDRFVPNGGGRGFAAAGSLLHGAGKSPTGGEDNPGVVAIMNAALYHVGGFRRQVDETLKEWKELHEFAEKAILAEKASLDWYNFASNPMDDNAAMRSDKAEKEILRRAAVKLRATLSQHFVRVTETTSAVDDEEEHLQFDDSDTDKDGDLAKFEEDEFVDVEERKVQALVRSLLHNTRSDIKQSFNWAVICEGDPTQDQLPKWEDLPTAGNFKVAKPGGRSSRARASDLEKENQTKKYSKYLRWASECCGVPEKKFADMVNTHGRSGKLVAGRH